MSLWRRLRDGVFGGRAPSEEPPNGPDVAVPSESSHADPGLRELAALAEGEGTFADEARAADLFARLRAEGHEADALVFLQRILATREVSADYAMLVANALFERGEDEKALALLTTRLDVLSPERLLVVADALLRHGDADQAREVVERALALDVRLLGGKERLARIAALASPRRNLDATMLGGDDGGASRYRVLRRLGKGGAGTVMLAEDTQVPRKVALKTYHARGPSALARLLVEARSAAAFEHLAVVRVYDIDPERCSIAMEFHPGGSLAQALEDKALGAARLMGLLGGLAGALDEVHRAGVVHRDVKASNVLVGSLGLVLTDFGLARANGVLLRDGELHDGTPGIVPPEALRRGAVVAPSIDVFAFGKLLEAVARAYPELSEVLSPLSLGCVDVADARPTMSELSRALGDGAGHAA